MAYGQTGSGKSFTMLGPHCQEEPALPSEPRGDTGIVPRAAAELFRYRAGGEDQGGCGRHGPETGGHSRPALGPVRTGHHTADAASPYGTSVSNADCSK